MTFKKKLSALLAAGAIGLAGGSFGVVTPPRSHRRLQI